MYSTELVQPAGDGIRLFDVIVTFSGVATRAVVKLVGGVALLIDHVTAVPSTLMVGSFSSWHGASPFVGHQPATGGEQVALLRSVP